MHHKWNKLSAINLEAITWLRYNEHMIIIIHYQFVNFFFLLHIELLANEDNLQTKWMFTLKLITIIVCYTIQISIYIWSALYSSDYHYFHESTIFIATYLWQINYFHSHISLTNQLFYIYIFITNTGWIPLLVDF